MPEPIVLYDLKREVSDEADYAWSPNTWRTRWACIIALLTGFRLTSTDAFSLALNMKGIPYTTKWVDFTEIEPEIKKLGLPPNERGSMKYTVPTIYDPNTKRAITDSFKINLYLEDQYPDTFPLFPKGTRALQAAFISTYNKLLTAMFDSVVLNVYNEASEADKPYFRETRERWFGKKLEDCAPKGEQLEEAVKTWEQLLGEMGTWIDAGGPGALYFGGDAPVQADVDVISIFLFLVKKAPEGNALLKSLKNVDGGRWSKYLQAFSKWTT
jgi:glutathione S-transferase